MTLEQLKDRQQELNQNLLGLLDEQRTVVNTITGSEFSPSENTQVPFSGLIEEIALKQEHTQGIIEEFRRISRKLVEHTYNPEEPQYQKA